MQGIMKWEGGPPGAISECYFSHEKFANNMNYKKNVIEKDQLHILGGFTQWSWAVRE